MTLIDLVFFLIGLMFAVLVGLQMNSVIAGLLSGITTFIVFWFVIEGIGRISEWLYRRRVFRCPCGKCGTTDYKTISHDTNLTIIQFECGRKFKLFYGKLRELDNDATNKSNGLN